MPEPHSIRQIFYRDINKVENFVPDDVKETYPKWGDGFYNGMATELAYLFRHQEINHVTGNPISYRELNILDDSGASRWIRQEGVIEEPMREEDRYVTYPIEVWVENNATWNSLAPMFVGRRPEIALNLVSCKGWAKAQEIEKLKLDRAQDTEVLLYLTDFDPAGVYMGDQRFSVAKYLRYLELDIKLIRIGINPEHVPEERRFDSIHFYSARDKRAPRFMAEYGEKYPIILQNKGYEIQALMPPEIRELVRNSIEETVEEYDFEKREPLEDEGE